MAASLIGIDWGTSALRAYLIGEDGRVEERRASGHGIRALPPGGFAAALAEAVAGWPGGLPILMSGMVGSRSGWREAPYLEVGSGVGAADLAAALTQVETPAGPALVVPGMRTGPDAPPDVMRGEETQVLGVLDDGIAVLPGTHSKLVHVAGGRITGFRTSMTGEVYAALVRHTILADTLQPPADAAEARAGFLAGVEAGLEPGGAGVLLHRLFAVRAGVLLDRLPATQAQDYMSGLLIGAEIAAAGLEAGTRVTVIGEAALSERYAMALEATGAVPEIAPADAAAAGLYAIARLTTGGTSA